MLQIPQIFSWAIALLAFVLAFYGLVARERKSPYLTNSVYSTAFIILLSVVIALGSQVLARFGQNLAHAALIVANCLLGIGTVNIAYKIWRIHNRQLNFRDDNLIKNLGVVRWSRDLLRTLKGGPSYELDAPDLAARLGKFMREEGLFLETAPLEGILPTDPQRGGGTAPPQSWLNSSVAVVLRVRSIRASDDRTLPIALRFLREGWCVQFTTCVRHPFEIAEKLKALCDCHGNGSDWRELASRLVMVDAYTPHFGFTDSIHSKLTRRLKDFGIQVIKSPSTYAGVHTSAAKAFNRLKKAMDGKPRPMTLIIYENPYALVDLESADQYRIFIRHVLPSERLWGGMMTIVVETFIRDEDLTVLRSYADVFIDEVASVESAETERG